MPLKLNSQWSIYQAISNKNDVFCAVIYVVNGPGGLQFTLRWYI